VIASTTAVVEPLGVLGSVTCAPPLTLRQVRGDDPGRCELRLVGSAAGPLAGDDLSLALRLRPSARAALGAAGASLAQGRSGCGTAALSFRVELDSGASLIADPGPLIVCAGSRVDVRLELALGAGAAVEWRELIVLGRTGESPGQATVRWDVTRLGRPVLRQFAELDLGLTGGRRVLACALIADPGRMARTLVASATAVAQRVDEHTLLVSVLEDDAVRATRELDGLCAWSRGLLPALVRRGRRSYSRRCGDADPVGGPGVAAVSAGRHRVGDAGRGGTGRPPRAGAHIHRADLPGHRRLRSRVATVARVRAFPAAARTRFVPPLTASARKTLRLRADGWPSVGAC
jgi:urease accessory protein